MRTRTHSKLPLAAVAALAVALTGCGGADDDPAGEPDDLPTASETLPPDDGGGGAAGGTTMRVYTVPEAMTADEEGSIHVSGLLIDDGSGWRLCESVLESMPPQCGGESLLVEDLDEAGRPIEEASGVRWQDGATVVGEVTDGTITVTGSPASS